MADAVPTTPTPTIPPNSSATTTTGNVELTEVASHSDHDHKLQEQIRILKGFTPCDISDALQKLGVPGAGFIPDLVHRNKPPTSTSSSTSTPTIIAPATTIHFLPLPLPPSTTLPIPPRTIPQGTHYADLAPPHTILLLSHPPSALTPLHPPRTNALLGSLVAHRLAYLNVTAVLVNGRVRDIATLPPTPPIFSKGISTVGAGGGSVAWGVNWEEGMRLEGTETVVVGGDLLVVGGGEGEGEGEVVCIPRGKVGEVVDMLPGMVERDARVLEDVLKGRGLAEAIKAWR
ncbi:hypothetical protein DFH27DRAFT_614451 [Peziza echinospora]|nr:hypothetical protein DFH27DRAFT_614451 [Peziza echinospora]